MKKWFVNSSNHVESNKDEDERAHTLTDESLDATRRIVALCQQSQHVGEAGIVRLDGQGAQLDRVDQGTERIHQDMKAAEQSLEELEKCCGLCVLPWKRRRPQASNTTNNTWARPPSERNYTMQPEHRTEGAHCSREAAIESNIDDISVLVGNLKNMAQDMGQELSFQDRQVERVNVRAGTLDQRVRNANQRANKILNEPEGDKEEELLDINVMKVMKPPIPML